MKNFVSKLTILTLIVSTTLLIGSSCKKEEPPHEHTFAETWTIDYDYHYKKATCEHTDEYDGRGNHTYENNVCSVCGYAKEAPYLSMSLNDDGQSYSASKNWEYPETNIVIPATYKGKPVTSVGGFYQDKNIVSVVIGENVKSILANAFGECTNLQSVTLPNNLESIGHGAFKQCTSLTSIVIPDNVSLKDGAAFTGCANLKSVTFGNNVKNIGASSFSNCLKLTNLTLPDSLESIGNDAFYKCVSLIKLVIPNNVTSIGYTAFSECTNLYSVTIGEKVPSLNNNTFKNCYKLIEVINKSPNFMVERDSHNEHVGKYALKIFNSNDAYNNIFNIDVNGFVTYSGTNGKILVNYVGSQTEITIPEDVADIRPYALYGIDTITSVAFEDSATWYVTNNGTDWSYRKNGTEINVTVATDNLTAFSNTYKNYYWYKKLTN